MSAAQSCSRSGRGQSAGRRSKPETDYPSTPHRRRRNESPPPPHRALDYRVSYDPDDTTHRGRVGKCNFWPNSSRFLRARAHPLIPQPLPSPALDGVYALYKYCCSYDLLRQIHPLACSFFFFFLQRFPCPNFVNKIKAGHLNIHLRSGNNRNNQISALFKTVQNV